jgi:hypothetical protein
MIALVLLILLVALGAASVLGFTPDTRDPDYGLGQVIGSRARRCTADPAVNGANPQPSPLSSSS